MYRLTQLATAGNSYYTLMLPYYDDYYHNNYCTVQILSKHTPPQLRTILIKDKLFGPMVSVIWDKEAFIDTIKNTSTSATCAAYSSYQIVVGGQ